MDLPTAGNIADILNILLIVLVLPFFHTIKKTKEHDAFMMKSIAESSKSIEQLRVEMIASQRRHERIEDAILFLANDEKVKEVIAILRGFKKSERK